jgi:hypothetical protein
MFTLYTRKRLADKAEWKTEDTDENYLCEEVAVQYIESMRYERVMVVQNRVDKKPLLIMSWNRGIK